MTDLFLSPAEMDAKYAEEVAPAFDAPSTEERAKSLFDNLKSNFVPSSDKVPCEDCTDQKLYTERGLNLHRSRMHGAEKSPAVTTVTGEKKPKGSKPAITGKRHSGGEIIGLFLSGIGAAALRAGVGPSSSFAALVWEAPIAGRVLDRSLANTFVDKHAIQPLARAKDAGESVGAVLLLPILLGVMEKQPHLLPMVYPLAREAMGEVLTDMIPVLEERAKKADKLKSALDRLGELDPEMAQSNDLIGDMLASFMPSMQEVPVEEPGSAWPE